ncbi:MAG: DUF484 family protein [Burkholderiaceae bacterium]|nr:DUF484 family protein [Burkholderiaceae bacterium]
MTIPNAINPITEDDIANYLINTPDFFARHAQLLAQVQLSSPHGGRAVSLQERQAEMLREKIKALEHRVMDMVRYGNENAIAMGRLQRWACSLLSVGDPRALPQQMAVDLQTLFLVPQVAIKVWGCKAEYSGESYAQGVSEEVRALATSLEAPYCGANTGFEAARWLDDTQAVVSMALIALRAEPQAPAFGLLVLASPDAQRFRPDMGTEFLERIAELASAALLRLCS